MPKSHSKILHVDGDNFFAACEIARFPHLKGKPVVVGEERGIACAMSYEAKRLGITRATPIFEIRQKFPEVAILPAHFELYEQYADKLATILEKYSKCVERYSIDECFALIEIETAKSGRNELHKLLKTIKDEAELCLGITLSFGLADTKTLAKIGSKLEKPSGCVVITEHERIQILEKTDIGKVWGIGRAISAKLTSFNIKTAYDFTKLEGQFVKKHFGEGTLATWHELRGELRYGVDTESHIHKSLQSTRSFGKSLPVRERSFFLSELSNHAENLAARLRSYGLMTNHASFFFKKNTDHNRYISTDVEIGFYTNSPSDIFKKIKEAAEKILDGLSRDYNDYNYKNLVGANYPANYSTYNSTRDSNRHSTQNFGFKIKATGISIYRLRPVGAVQDDLFSTQSTQSTHNKYFEAVDSLQKRFGDDSIYLCSSLESKVRRHKAFEERNARNQFIYGLPLPYMGEVK